MFLSAAYLFAQGDTKRSYAYMMVYGIIVLSIVCRAVSIYSLNIDDSPVTDHLQVNIMTVVKSLFSFSFLGCEYYLVCAWVAHVDILL
jgi:hypothetical protein